MVFQVNLVFVQSMNPPVTNKFFKSHGQGFWVV